MLCTGMGSFSFGRSCSQGPWAGGWGLLPAGRLGAQWQHQPPSRPGAVWAWHTQAQGNWVQAGLGNPKGSGTTSNCPPAMSKGFKLGASSQEHWESNNNRTPNVCPVLSCLGQLGKAERHNVWVGGLESKVFKDLGKGTKPTKPPHGRGGGGGQYHLGVGTTSNICMGKGNWWESTGELSGKVGVQQTLSHNYTHACNY